VTDRIRTTAETYDRVADAFLANTRDRSRTADWLDDFAAGLPASARVLDLGSGAGVDSAQLRARGLEPIAMDLSMGMLRAGVTEFPGPRVRADMRRLPFALGSMQGVWANASLLHLDVEECAMTLRALATVCAQGALLHLSVKQGEGSRWERERYGLPRWFQFWNGDTLDAQIQAAGWRGVEAFEARFRTEAWLIRRAVLD
jgi:SAM-dependent methyltransferase